MQCISVLVYMIRMEITVSGLEQRCNPLLKNTKAPIVFHILHDDTLNEINKNKAESYC